MWINVRPRRRTYLLVRSSICPVIILLLRYLMNGLNNRDKNYREYSIAHIDDLIKFWRSKITVIAGRQGGEGIHVNAGASTSIF